MATTLCPTCGTARTGSFRYCRSCGFDYDAGAVDAAGAVPAIATAQAPSPEAAAVSATTEPQRSDGDVIVLQVRQVKLAAWTFVGGLIGALLAGSLVAPFFGAGAILLGSVAAIATIVVAAFIGLRLGMIRLNRRARQA